MERCFFDVHLANEDDDPCEVEERCIIFALVFDNGS